METKMSGISKMSAIIASVTVVTGAMGLGMATVFIAGMTRADALVILTPAILGVAAGIGLFLQARWALIATMIFYLLQTVAIEWIRRQRGKDRCRGGRGGIATHVWPSSWQARAHCGTPYAEPPRIPRRARGRSKPIDSAFQALRRDPPGELHTAGEASWLKPI